jgi:hypothetical protein
LGRKAKLNLAAQMVTFSAPAPVTTLPDTIVIDTTDLHPVAIRLLETIISETRLSAEVAAAALLNSAANDRQAKPPL